jgi:hypothetical protein
MAEMMIVFLSTAFLCGTGVVLSKLCTIRIPIDHPPPKYLLITQEHYDALLERKNLLLIEEQPQLPKYTES